MNGLMKQLFTPNSQVAQLSEHNTEDLRRACWPCCNTQLFPNWYNIQPKLAESN